MRQIGHLIGVFAWKLVIKMVIQSFINLRIFKGGNIVRRAQYDDIYFEWWQDERFKTFSDYEEEEAYARQLNRVHY